MDANPIFHQALKLFEFQTVLLTMVALGFLYALATALRGTAEGLATTFPSARLTIYQGVTILTFLTYALGVTATVIFIVRPPQGLRSSLQVTLGLWICKSAVLSTWAWMPTSLWLVAYCERWW